VLFTNSQVDITNVVNGYITCHYYLFVIMLILVSMNKLGLVYKIGIIQVHIFVGLFITLIKYGICSNTIHFLLTSYNNDDFTVDIANTTSMSTLGSTIAYNSSISTLGKECIPWHVNDKVLKAQDVLLEMFKYISKEPNQAAFAKEYLEPLVNPLTGDTNLAIDFISKEAIMSNDKTFIINNEGDAVRTGNQFKNMMGIYSFTSNEYNIDNTYIGLTQNFTNRIKMHYLLSERPHKHYGSLYPYIYSNGGMKEMLFHINLLFPTYQSLWLTKFKFGVQNYLIFFKHLANLK
jgi:hypothetical protein